MNDAETVREALIGMRRPVSRPPGAPRVPSRKAALAALARMEARQTALEAFVRIYSDSWCDMGHSPSCQRFATDTATCDCGYEALDIAYASLARAVLGGGQQEQA